LPCLIDDSASPDFVRQRKALEKNFPKISVDLASLYEDIRKDYKKVQQAHSVPGFKNLLWKYRCESSDMARGKSGSFRVLGYYREEDNTMYMLFVHPKSQFEQPPVKDLTKWVKNVTVAFSSKSDAARPNTRHLTIIMAAEMSIDGTRI
jgi:mRNA-degrading endonuclease RelE of RelBE toxin-antitoxin system